jgi:hypothetical protein
MKNRATKQEIRVTKRGRLQKLVIKTIPKRK